MSSTDSRDVMALLQQARQAVNASNPEQALQCVVQALTLLKGDNAVIPVLRNAAMQYHAQRAAPIDEISALLAQVSLQAAQQAGQQHQQPQAAWQQQQPAPWPQQQHQQRQQQLPPQLLTQLAGHHQPPQHLPQQQQPFTQPQQQPQHHMLHSSHEPILNESGRGAFTEFALADGSSWQCPHCGGVVLQQRKAAHLQHWCPKLPGSSGDAYASP